MLMNVFWLFGIGITSFPSLFVVNPSVVQSKLFAAIPSYIFYSLKPNQAWSALISLYATCWKTQAWLVKQKYILSQTTPDGDSHLWWSEWPRVQILFD